MMRVHTMNRQGSQSIAPAPTTPSAPQFATSKYAADVVQHLLDQAAYFNLYSSPLPPKPSARIAIRKTNRDIGFHIREQLHRFEILMESPDPEFGLRASNNVGEEIGTFESRWLFCPNDFEALPSIEPPPKPFDPTSRQRFVMLDGDCVLGSDGDGFYGFGTGTTFPSTDGKLLVAAVGNVMEGRGCF